MPLAEIVTLISHPEAKENFLNASFDALGHLYNQRIKKQKGEGISYDCIQKTVIRLVVDKLSQDYDRLEYFYWNTSFHFFLSPSSKDLRPFFINCIRNWPDILQIAFFKKLKEEINRSLFITFEELNQIMVMVDSNNDGVGLHTFTACQQFFPQIAKMLRI
jgi:hypothetical protein